jgi:hypothetical protein
MCCGSWFHARNRPKERSLKSNARGWLKAAWGCRTPQPGGAQQARGNSRQRFGVRQPHAALGHLLFQEPSVTTNHNTTIHELIHIALYVTDVKHSAWFYQRVLKLELIARPAFTSLARGFLFRQRQSAFNLRKSCGEYGA